MVEHGIVLEHVVSVREIEVNKAKVDIISALPYPVSVRKVRSFVGHAGVIGNSSIIFQRLEPPFKLLHKNVTFDFTNECKATFDKLKESLTSPPISQPPN